MNKSTPKTEPAAGGPKARPSRAGAPAERSCCAHVTLRRHRRAFEFAYGVPTAECLDWLDHEAED